MVCKLYENTAKKILGFEANFTLCTCLPLGNLLNFSKMQFPHLWNGNEELSKILSV